MRNHSYPLIALALLLLFSLAAWTSAGHHGCAHCGCQHECQKVCRLVREEKKVTITCWGCKSEDFCLPGHSHRDCKHCDEVCETCDTKPDDVCSQPKKFVWYDWIPGCSKGIRTKTKLMKKTITKSVPSFKWVVEDLCAQCVDKCDIQPPSGGDKLPPLPVPGAKVVYGRPE